MVLKRIDTEDKPQTSGSAHSADIPPTGNGSDGTMDSNSSLLEGMISNTAEVHEWLPIPTVDRTRVRHLEMNYCEFRPSPIHRLGVFATEDIPAGTNFVIEKATWVVDKVAALGATFSRNLDHREARERMLVSFRQLEKGEKDTDEMLRRKREVLTLNGGVGTMEKYDGGYEESRQILTERLREILIRNAIAESNDEFPDYVALFTAVSRFNHSCAPNAERMRSQLDDGSKWCVVHATLPIKKDQEILVNYVDPLAQSSFRQHTFQSRYGFTCKCHLCTRSKQETDASDDRREKIFNAIKLIADLARYHAAPKPASHVEAAWDRYLKQCDKATLGEKGWDLVEKFAEKEGVNDIKLYNTMHQVADAAKRSKKLTLETRLVDRCLAVCNTNTISDEAKKDMADRRELLRRTAKIVANLAGLTFVQKGG